MNTAPISDTVNTWFAERLATGAIARNTEAYNQAVAALPDLIARLGGTTSNDAPAAPAPATSAPSTSTKGSAASA